MSETKRTSSTPCGKAGKGSKAACEAAGWQFAPLTSVHYDENGKRHRFHGSRGYMAIPPAGFGIEPRQFGGSGRAIAWAVEHLGQVAQQPDDAPAGMAGIHLLLSAALASGAICGGRDDTPARPDAELLTICNDALAAAHQIDRPGYMGGVNDPHYKAWSANFKEREQALRMLPELHATTREGLLQKARTARLVYRCSNIPCSVREDVIESLILDLIHLVPTLIDVQERSTVPPAADAEGVA